MYKNIAERYMSCSPQMYAMCDANSVLIGFIYLCIVMYSIAQDWISLVDSFAFLASANYF